MMSTTKEKYIIEIKCDFTDVYSQQNKQIKHHKTEKYCLETPN